MAEYTGSRRANDPFTEDDAMPTCPKCGAGVRPDQEWCMLCLHVLRAPEAKPETQPGPEPVPATAAPDAVELATPSSTAASSGLTMVGGVAQVATAPRVPPEQVEEAAEALLAQLALEARGQRLNVPSFLDSNLKIAAAVTAAIAGFCFVVVVGLSIVGAVLR